MIQALGWRIDAGHEAEQVSWLRPYIGVVRREHRPVGGQECGCLIGPLSWPALRPLLHPSPSRSLCAPFTARAVRRGASALPIAIRARRATRECAVKLESSRHSRDKPHMLRGPFSVLVTQRDSLDLIIDWPPLAEAAAIRFSNGHRKGAVIFGFMRSFVLLRLSNQIGSLNQPLGILRNSSCFTSLAFYLLSPSSSSFHSLIFFT